MASPTLREGVGALLVDDRTEFPDTINVIQRFNIFQEIFCAILYRIANSTMEPLEFYTRCVFAVYGIGVGGMVMLACRLNKSIFGGMAALIFYVGLMQTVASRMWIMPALRESFGVSLLFLQLLSLASLLRSPAKPKAADLAKFVLATLAFMMSWQLTHFLMFTQAGILFGLHLVAYVDSDKMIRIFSGYVVVLGALQLVHCGGNAMFLVNSLFAQSVVTVLITINLRQATPLRSVTGVVGVIANAVGFVVVFAVLKTALHAIVDAGDANHVFEVLKVRFGMINTTGELWGFAPQGSLLTSPYPQISTFVCTPSTPSSRRRRRKLTRN